MAAKPHGGGAVMMAKPPAAKEAFDWRKHLKVHAVAELFPRLSETELKELGNDLVANGQRMPIVMQVEEPESHPPI
jgi:hypothetical protein